MDLCATSGTILIPEDGPQVINTGVFSPPPSGTYFLILGRASATLSGITIFPSVVDADYEGEIKVLAAATKGPLNISPGQRIAQALPVPFTKGLPHKGGRRGASNPGSSDAYWVQPLTKERPLLMLSIDGKSFEGLLDSGADSTVLSQEHWPSSWPLQPSSTHLQGIGQSHNTLQSSKILTWSDGEGNSGQIQPFVVPGLPVNLWGRDILAQMGAILCSPNEVVTKQMLQSGFIPGKGLGKSNQGINSPIETTPKTNRHGLGYKEHFS